MKNLLTLTLALFMGLAAGHAEEYHVAKGGSDLNPGTKDAPFLTISKAAAVARAGDIVTVHAGTYREWVNPRNSGSDKYARITYQAAEGEEVWIKGSDQINNWTREKKSDVWKVVLPNSYFGDFNPYKEILAGDWVYYTQPYVCLGEVYLNGKALWQTGTREGVNDTSEHLCWYVEVDDNQTVIYANFGGADPNKELAEINVRPAVFYPKLSGVNFITVRGFHLSQAATQWAPPTAYQEGLIGPHWSKGWVIEDNEISHSKCVGVSLGKDRASGHNRWTTERELIGFNRELESIFKAYNMGWNKENIGSHVIRRNEIRDCGQAGVVGHLGGVFSTIEDNYIHDINYNVQFGGAEVGCIKLHAAIDVLVKDNVLDNGVRGMWLDWQAIGTRVTGNTFAHNTTCDLMIEVSHGPCLVDNNIMLSPVAFLDMAQGTAFVHNIICGEVTFRPVPNRYTPYHAPHSTDVVGVMNFPGGDDRFYNNVFYGAKAGLSVYDERPPYYPSIFRDMNTVTVRDEMPEPFAERLRKGSVPAGSNQGDNFWLPMHVAGNVYYNGVPGYKFEKGAATGGNVPMPEMEYRENGIFLKFTLDGAWNSASTRPVDTEMLEKAYYTDSYYENRDETPLRIDHDFAGALRNFAAPKPGPFENASVGQNEIMIWKFQ